MSILFRNKSQRRGILQRLLDKYSHLFICISLKQTSSSGQKHACTVKILMPEKIAITAVVYRGQVFVFCRLINKSVLERFLLIMHKQHTLRRSTNLFSRNLPKLCFTEQVLYQTDNSSHQRCSNFNYFLISRKFPFFFFFFLFKKCEKKSPFLF